jgi:hypothetical protein
MAGIEMTGTFPKFYIQTFVRFMGHRWTKTLIPRMRRFLTLASVIL